jgi:hypothetical protein
VKLSGMKGGPVWVLAVVAATVALGAYFVLDREGRRAAVAADAYQASDPALVASTGRPQLVEFYHRA